MSLLIGLALPAVASDFFDRMKVLAEQGDAEAQKNIALMYEDGEEVLQDSHQAFIWFEKAAN